MADRFRDILVVDLLGGLGDLCMLLPSVHALHRRHPDATLRVLTHAPGDELLRSDPAVAEVRRAPKGRERAAVVAELDRCRPDLVVSTTRYDGIAEEIESRGMRSVTNLWRHPPPDEPVGRRYLAILAEEGLVDPDYRPPSIHLTPAERAAGERALARVAPAGPGDSKATMLSPGDSKATMLSPGDSKATMLTSARGPVVLVPGAGMAVKRWPHWPALVAALPEPPLVVDDGAPPIPGTRPLPPTDLRGLAALFAAVAARGGVVIGSDTGPVRVAAAVGARTVGLFGPTAAARYGLDPPAVDLQGLPGCPHRRPTAIAEQVCWWDARCPLSATGPACMADISPEAVLAVVT